MCNLYNSQTYDSHLGQFIGCTAQSSIIKSVELVDFGMGVSPEQAPDKAESVTIGLVAGV